MPLFSFTDPDRNPEKEPSPERKTWSQERLRAEREAEAEFNGEKNKERARELKKAAKKRGEELERQKEARGETQEGEIAPKGEKLRKKWRRALLKKSRDILDFFRAEDPPEIDEVRLAELMVAERIVALNAYLETTQPKTDERRGTKTELDFMGLLSEKLSDPDIEVPVEIEKVHQQIVEEALKPLDQPIEIDPHNLPKFDTAPGAATHETKAEHDTADERQDKAFARHGAIVLAVLAKVLHGSARATATVGAISAGDIVHGVSVVPAAIGAAGAAAGAIVSAEAAAATVLTAAVVHEVLKTEPHEVAPKAPEPVTMPAVGEQPARPAEAMRASSLQPATPPAMEARGESIGKPHAENARAMAAPAESAPIIPVAPLPRAEAQPEAPAAPVDYRKLEHRRTLELLELAATVDLGHGQYLRRAYESGRIDRDGLIAVLKARARGQDYRRLYVQVEQAFRERRQSESSPERAPVVADKPSIQPAPEASEEATSQSEVAPSDTNEEAPIQSILSVIRNDTPGPWSSKPRKPQLAIIVASIIVGGLVVVGIILFR